MVIVNIFLLMTPHVQQKIDGSQRKMAGFFGVIHPFGVENLARVAL